MRHNSLAVKISMALAFQNVYHTSRHFVGQGSIGIHYGQLQGVSQSYIRYFISSKNREHYRGSSYPSIISKTSTTGRLTYPLTLNLPSLSGDDLSTEPRHDKEDSGGNIKLLMVALPRLVRMVSPKNSSFEGFSRISSSRNNAQINVKTVKDLTANSKGCALMI